MFTPLISPDSFVKILCLAEEVTMVIDGFMPHEIEEIFTLAGMEIPTAQDGADIERLAEKFGDRMLAEEFSSFFGLDQFISRFSGEQRFDDARRLLGAVFEAEQMSRECFDELAALITHAEQMSSGPNIN